MYVYIKKRNSRIHTDRHTSKCTWYKRDRYIERKKKKQQQQQQQQHDALDFSSNRKDSLHLNILLPIGEGYSSYSIFIDILFFAVQHTAEYSTW